MSIEILSLFAFLGLFAALLLTQPLVLFRARGMQYVTGNRDEATDASHPVVGRLARTVNNSIEAAVLFIPLVLVAEILGVSNGLTQYGAMAFVVTRAAYAVCYSLGVTGLRTLVWNAGLTALAVMAAGLLIG